MKIECLGSAALPVFLQMCLILSVQLFILRHCPRRTIDLMGERFIYDRNKNAIKTGTGLTAAAKPTAMEREMLSAIKLLEKHLERIEVPAKKKKKSGASKRSK